MEDGKEMDGVLFMSALAAQSAADLAHTTNMLTENALRQALELGEQLQLLWLSVDKAQERGNSRAVDKALYRVDIHSVGNSLQHIRGLLATYEGKPRS